MVFNDQHIGHHHELNQHQEERQIAPPEGKPRKRIGRERTEDHLRHQDHGDQHDGVQKIARERCGTPGCRKIIERERCTELEAR